MSNETIRGAIVDSINEMTKLLEVCTNANQKFEIRLKIRELFHRLDRVIIASLDAESEDFKEALASLHELTQKAKGAKADLAKIVDTINKAADVVSKVEKLVKNVTGIIAVL